MVPRRLAILEPVFGDRLGHILTYSARLREAAARRGVETWILGGPKARQADPMARPHFAGERRWYAPGTASLAARVANVASWMSRLGIDFARALRQLAKGPPALAVVPTAVAEHAGPLAAALACTAPGTTRLALVFHDRVQRTLETRRVDALHRRLSMLALAPFVRRGIVRLFSDSEGLARQWSAFAGLPFGTLPVPVDVGGIAPSPLGGRPRLRFLYAGGARRDKGFLLLPALARAAADGRLGRPVEMVVQATIDERAPDRDECLRTREQLIAIGGGVVRIVEGVLTPEMYLAEMAAADVVLIAYDPEEYGQRTSGILAESLALGRVAVSARGCWSGDRLLEAGAGPLMPTFDATGLLTAATAACRDFERYAAAAAAARSAWLAGTSTDALLDALLRGTDRHPGRAPDGRGAGNRRAAGAGGRGRPGRR